jgi:enamine deaminase RidA (YjgF/YER057c/UK114 family)
MARQTIYTPPVGHTNPVPMAARVGNFLFSSGIAGYRPEDGELPADIDEQTANCFRNMRNVLAKADMTPDDVVHVTVFVKDNDNRAKVNGPWLEMFPDEDQRPARHQLVQPTLNFDIQIEIVAIKDG